MVGTGLGHEIVTTPSAVPASRIRVLRRTLGSRWFYAWDGDGVGVALAEVLVDVTLETKLDEDV